MVEAGINFFAAFFEKIIVPSGPDSRTASLRPTSISRSLKSTGQVLHGKMKNKTAIKRDENLKIADYNINKNYNIREAF